MLRKYCAQETISRGEKVERLDASAIKAQSHLFPHAGPDMSQAAENIIAICTTAIVHGPPKPALKVIKRRSRSNSGQ